MNDTEVIEVARQALLITMEISAPVLIVGLVVGVAIALLQALTQIQEMTLVFVPKIMAIFFSMFFHSSTHNLTNPYLCAITSATKDF